MGKYPVECVETMVKISNSIESSVNYWGRFVKKGLYCERTGDILEDIAYTSCAMAEHMKADAIVAYTHSGNSVNSEISITLTSFSFKKDIAGFNTS